MEGDKIIQLRPEDILADDNARFSILDVDVDKLAEDILTQGGVLMPLEVEPLDGAKKGDTPAYHLTSGHIRHRAVEKLNREQNAGLTLPVIVRPLGDSTLRLRHQVAENVVRKSLSPMDTAVAIKKLLDLNVSRTDVAVIFARVGGRKGTVLAPVSSSFINMHLNLLQLPKSVQDKINDGRVSLTAAYQLGKVAPDKRAAVLEKAEADRLKAVEDEEKDEERLAAEELKVSELQDKERRAAEALAVAEAAVKEINKITTQKAEAAAEAYRTLAKTPKAEKKMAEEIFKKLDADAKDSEKKVFVAQKALEKLQTQASTAAELTAKKQAALEAARKAAPKASAGTKKGGKVGKDAVGPSDITQAAKKLGASKEHKPLVMSQTREGIKELTLPGTFPKVKAIGEALMRFIDGVTWPKVLLEELAVITGEKVESAPAPAAKPSGKAKK